MRGDVILFALAISLACLHYGNACSCMPAHPQTKYCKADFVILARVKREKTFNETRIYKVRVRTAYKMSEKASVALKSGRLITAVEGAMCGASLNVGKVYVISGRVNSLRAHINLCDMAMPWRELTRRQRKGFKAIYKHGCDCNIEHCVRRRGCKKTPDSCLHTNDCHVKEGICLRQLSKKCMWTRNRALTTCLKPDLMIP